jgi:hypothetical protein
VQCAPVKMSENETAIPTGVVKIAMTLTSRVKRSARAAHAQIYSMTCVACGCWSESKLNRISRAVPKFPPALAASIGLETVVDGKHENTAIPFKNSLDLIGATCLEIQILAATSMLKREEGDKPFAAHNQSPR